MNFRKTPPPINFNQAIKLETPEIFSLDNGMEVHQIESGEQDVLLLELCFKTGRWYEPKPQVSHFTHAILKEGTKNFTSQQIAEKLEYYGATMKVFAGFDYCTLSVSTLNKYLEPILQIVQEVLENASFPEQELNIYRNNVLQEFALNSTKHEYIATKTFGTNLWGKNHPYGYPTRPIEMQNVSISAIKNYFKTLYKPQNTTLFIAGKSTQDFQKLLNKYIGSWKKGITLSDNFEPKIKPNFNLDTFLIEDAKAHQVSLRMGMHILEETNDSTRNNKEYTNLFVLNTVLGGYFGSRLMANIREEKGYTYGIYSTIINMVNGSYLSISTEVGKDVWKDCENEIYKEINRLKNELVSDAELNMVKNYLSGYLLSLIDGGFNRLACWKELFFQELNVEYFNTFAEEITQVTPKQILDSANKYLEKDKMLKVFVGQV